MSVVISCTYLTKPGKDPIARKLYRCSDSSFKTWANFVFLNHVLLHVRETGEPCLKSTGSTPANISNLMINNKKLTLPKRAILYLFCHLVVSDYFFDSQWLHFIFSQSLHSSEVLLINKLC